MLFIEHHYKHIQKKRILTFIEAYEALFSLCLEMLLLQLLHIAVGLPSVCKVK